MKDKGTLLGKETVYPQSYSPELLCPIPREEGRAAGELNKITFFGVDLWTAYEFSWLDNRGKPQVRVGRITIPCDSTHLVESKSFKLYLNSLNNCRFASDAKVIQRVEQDLSCCVEGQVNVRLEQLEDFDKKVGSIVGTCLDNLPVEIDSYNPAPDYLSTSAGDPIAETLYSHLLKNQLPSNWAAGLGDTLDKLCRLAHRAAWAVKVPYFVSQSSRFS